jgi:hypothetical protein
MKACRKGRLNVSGAKPQGFAFFRRMTTPLLLVNYYTPLYGGITVNPSTAVPGPGTQQRSGGQAESGSEGHTKHCSEDGAGHDHSVFRGKT